VIVNIYKIDACLTCEYFEIGDSKGSWVVHYSHNGGINLSDDDSKIESFLCNGQCKRNPSPQEKTSLDWCGEYSALKINHKHLRDKWYKNNRGIHANSFFTNLESGEVMLS